MKKTLLTIFCALFGLSAIAQSVKTYNEPYVVIVNGNEGEPQNAVIDIEENASGTINFVFKDLVVTMNGKPMSVGDVRVEDIQVVEYAGMRYFEKEGQYTIPATSLPAEMQAMASFFEDMDYTLAGKMDDEHLTAGLEIHVTKLGQEIQVAIGQTENSKVYTEDLIVIVDGNSTDPQPTQVTVVYNSDGTITFVLKNFFLGAGQESMPVGNIVVENLPVTVGEDGLNYISYQGNIVIQPGDQEGVDMWYGPMLNEIPVDLKGKMNDKKLYVTIDIVIGSQVVKVQLGTDDFDSKPGKTFTEQYVITINNEPMEPQTANIVVVENGDGTINFILPKFNIMGLSLGDVVLENIPAETGEDGYVTFRSDEGSTFSFPDENIPSQLSQMSSLFKNIPYTLNGKYNDEHLYATIDINMAGLGMAILVEVGESSSYAVGDVNGDNKIDIADAVSVLNAMAGAGSVGNADTNNDGKIDIADFVTVLNIMAGQ